MMQRLNTQHTGFTLFEMLVALSVLGLLVSLLYSTVSLGFRSWESAQDRVADMDRLRISWRFLHRTLTHAKPVSDPKNPDQGLLFQGSTQHLQCVTSQLADAGLAGLSVLRLEALPEQQLRLSYVPLSDYRQSDQSTPTQSTILVDDLEQLNIAYFGRQQAQSEPTWQANWLDPKRLPDLIRIQITSQALGVWPVMIVAPGSF